MKLPALLAALFLAAGTAHAQTTIPAKANTLILSGLGQNEEAWKQAAQTLAAAGWSIKTSSKDLLTFTTEPKDIGRGQRISLSAAVKDSLIAFTAAQTLTSSTPSRVEFRGQQGSATRRAWDAFEAAVKATGPRYQAVKR